MQTRKFSDKKNPALVLAAFLFLSLSASGQTEALKVRIIARRANIRAEAGLKSDIVRQVKRGTILRSDGKEGEWYRVRLPLKLEGYELVGYVHQSLVEEVGKETPLSKANVPEKIFPGSGYQYSLGLGLGLASPSEEYYGLGMNFSGNFYYKIQDKLALELKAQAFRSIIESDMVALGSQGLSNGKLAIFPVQLSLQGRFPLKNQIVPYAVTGIGYYLNNFSLEDKSFNQEEKVKNALGFHLGGGIDYFFKENIALNVDLRYCLVKSSGTWSRRDPVSGARISGEIVKINLNSLMLGVGVKYFF